jgi:hypothetical protein
MANKANLVIDQGTDFNTKIDLFDDADQPYDLTGFTVKSQMRKNYASETSYDFGATHNDDLGQIFLSMDNELSGSLEPGRYLYDVEITSSSNNISRVVEGIVTVTPGITRN